MSIKGSESRSAIHTVVKDGYFACLSAQGTSVVGMPLWRN
jgi:hypothetical protein